MKKSLPSLSLLTLLPLAGVQITVAEAAFAHLQSEIDAAPHPPTPHLPIPPSPQPATTVTDWMAQIEASLVQITGVRLEETEAGLQIILETADGELAAPTTTVSGNALIAEISNAVLALPQGDEFQQFEPAEGIALVQVTELPNDWVQVVVTGTDAAPVAEVSTAAAGLTLSVSQLNFSERATSLSTALVTNGNCVDADQSPWGGLVAREGAIITHDLVPDDWNRLQPMQARVLYARYAEEFQAAQGSQDTPQTTAAISEPESVPSAIADPKPAPHEIEVLDRQTIHLPASTAKAFLQATLHDWRQQASQLMANVEALQNQRLASAGLELFQRGIYAPGSQPIRWANSRSNRLETIPIACEIAEANYSNSSG